MCRCRSCTVPRPTSRGELPGTFLTWRRSRPASDATSRRETGKTTAHTDTYHGHFVKLVPDEQIVEVMEFETADPAMRGEMTVTFTLTDAGGGTEISAVHDRLPPGLSPADNETGWREALAKLAALVEAG